MKHKTFIKFLAMTLSALLALSCLPLSALAAESGPTLSMTEGDVIPSFAPEGAACTSSDPSIAWVDENGSLNALKPGTVTVSDGETETTVTVEDYTDGSEVVGNLKILARYNDSMQFYDGHVYLLFTSYQDGVQVGVSDLYAGYEISDQYYHDIRMNIMNGSNHVGNDADAYFALADGMDSVTLDRGEIVTIGMYRDFDLTVPQAALGSIKNSSLWGGLVKAGKAAFVETLFAFLDSGKISTEEALAKLQAVLDETGLDYNKMLDGVVDGGVCFNRELYNQKLEWDQYENVTYEMDITKNQLDIMQLYLNGNLNKFSILKNSCATVALRAWNAAVGSRNGVDTAYHLSSTGEGIFSIIDAPKGVRDNIVSRLPGYYLNNAEGVAEPDAGYQDETGWVYVSAPEKVTPLTLVYEDDSLQIDERRTKVSSLINAAKAGRSLPYNKDEQEVGVKLRTSPTLRSTNIYGIDFTINGETVSLDAANDVWFKTRVDAPVEGEEYYAVDADGKAIPSVYDDGWVSFCAAALPASYQIIGSSEGTKNILQSVVINGDRANAKTEIYRKSGDEKIALDGTAEVKSGTTVYVKPTLADDEYDYLLNDISFDGIPIFNDDCYDAEEGAYYAVMPSGYAKLTVTYALASLSATGENILQISVGDTLNIADCAKLMVTDSHNKTEESDRILWEVISDPDGVLEYSGKQLTAVKLGEAIVWACAEGNENIGTLFSVQVYENTADLAAVTYSDETAANAAISAQFGEEEARAIPYSGYLVPKGTVLTIKPAPTGGKAVLSVSANLKPVKVNETVTVTGDTKITVRFADAVVSGVPRTVALENKGDTYQLNAKVAYTGIYQFRSVYDGSIRYISSDPLVKVDESGLMTVAQEIPKSGKAVYVTAIAGSSGDTVRAMCKVVVGAYQGEKTVGRLTISARPTTKGELVSHGALTFTTYEDLDMDVSFYHYYRPNDKYNALMVDYEQHPENYPSDPALCNDNELNLENRESYFDAFYNGKESAPETISLKAGESVTMSNYSFDPTNMETLRRALESDELSSSEEAQALIRQMKLYSNGEEIDSEVAFDGLVATLKQLYAAGSATGHNPADGHSEGGFDVNREIYNQFRRNDSQMPNTYYTVEITADERAMLQQYVSDPSNNYYSLMAMNCATGAVNIWNTALTDKPELQITANYTKLGADPMSLHVELGLMGLKTELDGEGGTNFYPRTIAYSDATRDAIDKIAAIGKVADTPDCKKRIDAARAAYDALNDSEKARVWNVDTLTEAESAYAALKPEEEKPVAGDANGDGVVTIEDVTAIQKHIAEIEAVKNFEAADIDHDGEISISDATLLQKYLAEYDDVELG